ncbi:spore germination protein [Paenibacillus nitricinens]|uniref:spore germination protein n=1 Tax=Paenibacillus nitricinens TaxID=3367691 RepID=UPI003F82DDD0
MNIKGLNRRYKSGKSQQDSPPSLGRLSIILTQTLEQIINELGDSPDLKIRHLKVGEDSSVSVAALYLSGLVQKEVVDEFIVGSLVGVTSEMINEKVPASGSLIEFILNRTLEIGDAVIQEDWKEVLLAILSGETVILIDGYASAIVCGTQGGETRSVTEPSSQLVVRGPKDSFVESLATNISLIRRRLKTPNLRLEYMKIGEVSHTYVGMLFIKGIVDEKLVNEVRERLNEIQIDAILESGYIEELIQDKTFTPFPTINNSERPDVAASNLLEGRVVLVIDGTPFILILPAVFTQFFQSSSDYAERFDISILMLFIRYISFIILILGPSIYIALTTFHYEMIPTTLLINLLSQRENVPFPAFVEAIVMEGAFEIIREAGVRMPRAVGQTVSVVGALILGQAVVEAGIITPVMVIVVALTGIASFAIPSYNMAIAGRLIRFAFLIFAGMFGFYGITLGLIILVAHMNSLRSFGIPYLSPIVPLSVKRQKDTFLRLPMWTHSVDQSSTQGKRRNSPEGEKINASHPENLAPVIEDMADDVGRQKRGALDEG